MITTQSDPAQDRVPVSLRRRATSVLVTGVVALALAACAPGDPMAGHEMSPAPASSTSAQTPADANEADVMFAQMMIPHHEQAVEMSDLLLAEEGVDPEVAALAEQIRAAQQPEIDTMRAWLTEWDADASDHGHMDHGSGGGMLTPEDLQALEAAEAAEAQRMYLEGMIEHHRGAVAMAQDEIADGQHPEAVALARSIVSSQQAEIDTMLELLEGLPSR